MPLERHYSLSAAARLIGVHRRTLAGWLRKEGIVIPFLRRGAKVMIRERDLELVLEKRRDARAAARS